MSTAGVFKVKIANAWHVAATFTPRSLELGHRGGATLLYDDEYAARFMGQNLASLSCLYPVNFQLYDSYPQSATDPDAVCGWPAFLLDIIPQGYGRDRLADKLGINGRLDSSDWQLLLAGAQNPIGNMRVESDFSPGAVSRRGFSKKDIVDRADDFVRYADEHGVLLPGSSGVQGDAPKMLLVTDHSGFYYADGTLPNDEVAEYWIIKLRRGRTERDLKVLRNEAAYMNVAAEMGLRANPGVHLEGTTLFIPRFDREGGVYLGQESLFSIAGVNRYGVTTTLQKFCQALAKHSTAPEEDIIEFVLRDVLNLVMGNTDNHGRNSAVLRRPDNSIRLSPIFDFAPMVLDPEGIARRFKWNSEIKGDPDWHDVMRELKPLLGRRHEEMVEKLHAFAEKLADLPDIMAAHNVDADLTEQRIHEIKKQRLNLKTL